MASIFTHLLRLVPWRLRDQIKSLPVIAPLQRKVLSSFLNGREFTHTVDRGPAKGITFLVQLPEDKGIWTGTYELDFAERLATSVKPDTVAYDIGSWHGFFAGVMAAQCARDVHVFEPLPANADRIRKLIDLNPSKSITLHCAALGDRDTEMNLLVMPETSMAKLEVSPFRELHTPDTHVCVQVRSIDSMIATGEIPPPDMMKVDVEGAELLVLSGARQTLRAYRPEIFMEIHSVALLEACSTLLANDGYAVESLDVDPGAARARDIYQIRAYATR